ncbi:dienelactone hydrolase family protein [Domibacillus robiginosus]|uniref:dienelactone hydrolase family protein n=1 Tax=Domibacillus robiginosus TaxID=1071054 RepID=UPI00067ACF09|nr:alpha/beta fold hydrolase [Domibacillus robiginosus]
MKQDAVVIVLHEIWGVNLHIKGVCRTLLACQLDVYCPDLLGNSTHFTYGQENEAYTFFKEQVGFEKAAGQVKALIAECRQQYKKVFLVGFSAGAAVAWICSGEKGVTGVIGFYGSRIRDYLFVTPACPVLLFFPESEPAFKVSEVIKALDHPLVQTVQYKAAHGFSDPFSSNYNQETAERAFSEVFAFIRKRRETDDAL